MYTTLSNIKVIKHVVARPTGTRNITLLDYSADPGPLDLQRVEMTLPECLPDVILPINIEMHTIKLPRERVRPSCYENHCKYVDMSDDGQIRGFFRANKRQRRERPWDTNENQLIMKFTIDMTQDPRVVTRGQVAPAQWSNEVNPEVDPTGKHIAFDGMRGRLCYVHPNVPDTVVIADIE